MKSNYKPLPLPSKLGFLSFLGDSQGCGTIRVIYPYLLLNNIKFPYLLIHATYLPLYIKDPKFYSNYVFFQFQRPATRQHLKMIDDFLDNRSSYNPNGFLICEVDDLTFDIPEWNYAHDFYKDKEPFMKEMMRKVDGMVVSTETLKKELSQYNSNIKVIENHLPKFVWGDIYPKHLNEPREKRPVILWGGSQNHFAHKKLTGEDIRGGDFGKELMKFIRKTTKLYNWKFVGAIPEELSNVKNQIDFYTWRSVFTYPSLFKSLEPDIGIAPLVDGRFNRCKSNIKQLEFAASGAVGVYSDVDPYKKTTLRAKTDEEMINYIEKLAKDVSFRAKVWKKDLERIRPQLFWEENNNMRNYINTYLSFLQFVYKEKGGAV